MENSEYKALHTFLSSPEEKRVWPEQVTTKDQKRNWRRKAASYSIVSGTLHYDHKSHGSVRVIKKDETASILKGCHSNPTSGHLGINKTWQKVASRYYWPGMYQDIQDFIGKFPSTFYEIF